MKSPFADQPRLAGRSVEEQLAHLEEQNLQLTRQVAELRNEDAMKTQFLANISHDLRTPLTAIITHAEILRDGLLGELNPRQRDSVVGMISGGRQLLEMVSDILTYARSAANQLTTSHTEFAIASLVDQVVSLSSPLASKRELLIEVEVEPGLPPVHADRDKLQHVLSNLIGNAVDFTGSGGRVWVRATRQASQPAPTILVEVGDTGIGIAPEHHELVFREFAQVDASPSRAHHGTGLGLAIARKFVELHDGRIWVESVLGEGSRFYFTLPCRPSRAE
ncbi:MAG: sensor histidine kinase [Gemmatimonadaceae bacterium]